MKEFNVTIDYTVTLFGSRDPLPKNICYGNVQVGKYQVQYLHFPKSGSVQCYMGGWNKRPNPTITQNALKVIKAVLEKNREEWEKLDYPARYNPDETRRARIARETRKAVLTNERSAYGAPLEKRAQREMLYRGKPRLESIDYEYTSGIDFIMPENNKYIDCNTSKRMEVGQSTAGVEQFLPKKNGMYIHDKLKCRNRKDVTIIPGQPLSKPVPDKSESEMRLENYYMQISQDFRQGQAGCSNRPTGHAFLGKPGGDARRKVIHGEQV